MEYKGKAKKRMIKHVTAMGGWWELGECDNKLNNLSRQIIKEFKQAYPYAMMGRFNEGEICVPVPEDTNKIYNFECDFVIPAKNASLESLIRTWREDNDNKALGRAIDFIEQIGGELLHWT